MLVSLTIPPLLRIVGRFAAIFGCLYNKRLHIIGRRGPVSRVTRDKSVCTASSSVEYRSNVRSGKFSSKCTLYCIYLPVVPPLMCCSPVFINFPAVQHEVTTNIRVCHDVTRQQSLHNHSNGVDCFGSFAANEAGTGGTAIFSARINMMATASHRAMPTESFLTCTNCHKRFTREFFNAFSRHLRTCNKDALDSLLNNEHEVLGRWRLQEHQEHHPLRGSVLLRPDHTFKLKLSCGTRTTGGHDRYTSIRRAEGSWSLVGEKQVKLSGEVHEKDRCTCGGARNDYHGSKAPFNMTLNTRNLVRDGSGPKAALCWHCKKPGHQRQACPDIQCFGCGKRGHMVASCPHAPSDHDSKCSADVK